MSLIAGESPVSRAETVRRRNRRQPLAGVIAAAQDWLLAAQDPDGHWCGELEGDTILETEYVLLLHFLGRLADPRVGKAARYVRRQQLPNGGWSIYPGGPPEVSASVKAYFVLKLAGHDPAAPYMQRARQTILDLGGIDACNSFTKIYLAICGQYEWRQCPAVPPEMVLLPRWFYFNLYEISSWSRAIVVPLSIVWALRPVRPVPKGYGIPELKRSTAAAAAGLDGHRLSGAPAASLVPAPGTGRTLTSRAWMKLVSAAAPASPPPSGVNAGPAASRPRFATVLPRLSASPLRNLALGGASRFWRVSFLLLDRALKTGEQLRLHPFRRRALARAEEWMVERLEDSDGLAAIFPPIVNTIFALCCLGYEPDHPLVRSQIHELERLEIEDTDGDPADSEITGPADSAGTKDSTGSTASTGSNGSKGPNGSNGSNTGGGAGTLRLQPCFSSVWDTALALHGLCDSSLPDAHPAMQAARRWLLDREIRRAGDWSIKAPGAMSGGWCFEYRNDFYPDCDDTAEVLTALSGLPGGGAEPAARRGLAWLLAMQNEDGGWGAFDRGCDKEILTHVPFADHNALLDPSTADVTGRVVDSLRRLGLAAAAPPVARALAFLRSQQEADGSWYGRWGCNYIYGTWLVLRALAACGDIAGDPDCRRAAGWLLAHQNPDGGWGESPRSYDDPSQKGIGPSTAAQTAWALMALMALRPSIPPGPQTPVSSLNTPTPLTPLTTAGDADLSAAIERGVEYLLDTQREDGSWYDEPWTATGFPRVFYLRYHLYAVYFPLMALAEYRRLQDETMPIHTRSTKGWAPPLPTLARPVLPVPADAAKGVQR